MNTTRRFTHVDRFGDRTEYVECTPDGVWAVDPDGSRTKCHDIPLAWCLEQVKAGVWKEIPVPPPAQEPQFAPLGDGEFALRIDDGYVEYRYVLPIGMDKSIRGIANAVAKAFGVALPRGTCLGETGTRAKQPDPIRRHLLPEEVDILEQADITDWSGLYFGSCSGPFSCRPSFDACCAPSYTTTWTPEQILGFRKWRKLTDLEVTRLRLAKPDDVSGIRWAEDHKQKPQFDRGLRYETTLTPEQVLERCWRVPTEAEFAALKTWDGWDWSQVSYRGNQSSKPCCFTDKRERYRTTLVDIRPWRRMTALECKVLKPGPRVRGDKTDMTEAEVVASVTGPL